MARATRSNVGASKIGKPRKSRAPCGVRRSCTQSALAAQPVAQPADVGVAGRLDAQRQVLARARPRCDTVGDRLERRLHDHDAPREAGIREGEPARSTVPLAAPPRPVRPRRRFIAAPPGGARRSGVRVRRLATPGGDGGCGNQAGGGLLQLVERGRDVEDEVVQVGQQVPLAGEAPAELPVVAEQHDAEAQVVDQRHEAVVVEHARARAGRAAAAGRARW